MTLMAEVLLAPAQLTPMAEVLLAPNQLTLMAEVLLAPNQLTPVPIFLHPALISNNGYTITTGSEPSTQLVPSNGIRNWSRPRSD